MRSVLIYGDSIGLGAWDSRGGWGSRLKEELYTRTVRTKGFEEFELYNLSVDGNSSSDILSRLQNELDTRYSSKWPIVLIYSYGINDQRMRNNKLETTKSKFIANTHKIIEHAKKYSDKIIFTGITPMGKSELELFGYNWNDDRIKEYDEALKKVVESANIKYILLRDDFERVGISKLMSFDALHPNDAGHKLIYEIVDKEIQEYLI